MFLLILLLSGNGLHELVHDVQAWLQNESKKKGWLLNQRLMDFNGNYCLVQQKHEGKAGGCFQLFLLIGAEL